jgi:hypothetical protein
MENLEKNNNNLIKYVYKTHGLNIKKMLKIIEKPRKFIKGI